jgi:hypothetical protein
MLTSYLHLLPMSRIVELYLQSAMGLHGVVLNELSTGTTSRFSRWLLPLWQHQRGCPVQLRS